jgi:hypothetical protein
MRGYEFQIAARFSEGKDFGLCLSYWAFFPHIATRAGFRIMLSKGILGNFPIGMMIAQN